MNIFEKNDRFRGDPYGWLPRGENAGVSFVKMKPLSVDDIKRFTSQLFFVEADPGDGVFIPNGSVGVTRDFGPCSAAILTGINDYSWLGHLKPGTGIPPEHVQQIRRDINAGSQLNIALVGGCEFNRTGMGSYRQSQIVTIQKQFADSGLSVAIQAYWNPVADSWMFAAVHANFGHAIATVAYEL